MSCMTPYHKKGEENLPLPCGKCPFCLATRVSQWSFRLMREDRNAKTANFVTFTYAPEHVPKSPNGYKTLLKKDYQDFMKRLRKQSPSLPKIKYYAVGEYGSTTMRPHYHAIIFNADIELVQKAWEKGYIYNGDVREESVGYTLKYINKKGKIPMHRNDDRIKEFSLMSKGLGESYLSENMINWHKEMPNQRVYCNLKGGRKIAMPRYYKNKIFDKKELYEFADYVKNLSDIKMNEYVENNINHHNDILEGIKQSQKSHDFKTQQLKNNRI